MACRIGFIRQNLSKVVILSDMLDLRPATFEEFEREAQRARDISRMVIENDLQERLRMDLARVAR